MQKNTTSSGTDCRRRPHDRVGPIVFSDEPTHGGYGMPRGLLGHVASPQPTAIGFCPLCHADAPGTCSNRGLFDCPGCLHVWFDSRVGEQTRSFEDYFTDV